MEVGLAAGINQQQHETTQWVPEREGSACSGFDCDRVEGPDTEMEVWMTDGFQRELQVFFGGLGEVHVVQG